MRVSISVITQPPERAEQNLSPLPNREFQNWEGPLPAKGDAFEWFGYSMTVRTVIWSYGQWQSDNTDWPQVNVRIR